MGKRALELAPEVSQQGPMDKAVISKMLGVKYHSVGPSNADAFERVRFFSFLNQIFSPKTHVFFGG